MFGLFKRIFAHIQESNRRHDLNAQMREAARDRLKDPELKKAVRAELEAAAEGPINALEAAMIMFQTGSCDLQQLCAALEHAEVRIMVRDHSDLHNSLLVLQHPDGTHRVPLFTENRRAESTVKQFPEYKYLLTVPAKQLISSLNDSVGLVINPYERVATFNLTPEQTRAFRECIK